MTLQDICGRVVDLMLRLKVREQLSGYSIAAEKIGAKSSSGQYHLIVLDTDRLKATVQSFGEDRLEEANEIYSAAEAAIREGHPLHAVLVKADSISRLREAYPSYFLDTGRFLEDLARVASIAAFGPPEGG